MTVFSHFVVRRIPKSISRISLEEMLQPAAATEDDLARV